MVVNESIEMEVGVVSEVRAGEVGGAQIGLDEGGSR